VKAAGDAVVDFVGLKAVTETSLYSSMTMA